VYLPVWIVFGQCAFREHWRDPLDRWDSVHALPSSTISRLVAGREWCARANLKDKAELLNLAWIHRSSCSAALVHCGSAIGPGQVSVIQTHAKFLRLMGNRPSQTTSANCFSKIIDFIIAAKRALPVLFDLSQGAAGGNVSHLELHR
jgi:hypothetical protein